MKTSILEQDRAFYRLQGVGLFENNALVWKY